MQNTQQLSDEYTLLESEEWQDNNEDLQRLDDAMGEIWNEELENDK